MFGSGDVRAEPRGRMGSGLEFVDLVNAIRYHIGQEGDEHPQVGALVLNSHPFQSGLDVPNLARHEVKKQSAHLRLYQEVIWQMEQGHQVILDVVSR